MPARQNCQALMTAPKVAENLFVPIARWGGMPVASSTGREIRPPPPAMASTKPAKNPPPMTNIRMYIEIVLSPISIVFSRYDIKSVTNTMSTPLAWSSSTISLRACAVFGRQWPMTTALPFRIAMSPP